MLIIIILASILLAIFMKIADNLNEHHLKMFNGANLLFGFLWGVCGSILILQHNILVNVWLAILLGWVVRAKVDRVNHGIGATIIFLTILFNLNNFTFDYITFFIFFIGMVVIGFTHDYLHNKINKTYSELFHSLLYYTLLPLVYSIVTNYWVIFGSLFSFVVAYDFTRFFLMKKKVSKW